MCQINVFPVTKSTDLNNNKWLIQPCGFAPLDKFFLSPFLSVLQQNIWLNIVSNLLHVLGFLMYMFHFSVGKETNVLKLKIQMRTLRNSFYYIHGNLHVTYNFWSPVSGILLHDLQVCHSTVQTVQEQPGGGSAG